MTPKHPAAPWAAALLCAATIVAQETRPAKPADPKDASALVERLEAESYDERRQAMEALRALGEDARPVLEARRDDRKLETRTRVRELLDELDERKRLGSGVDAEERRMAPDAPRRRGEFRFPEAFPAPPRDVFDFNRQMEEMRRWQAEVERMMRESMPRLGEDGPFGGERFRFDLGGPGVRSSGTFSMNRDGEQITLETGEDGVTLTVRPKEGPVTTYEGVDLDDLKAKHPEAAEALKDLGVLDGRVQIFRGGSPFAPFVNRRSEEPASRPTGPRRMTPAEPGADWRRRGAADPTVDDRGAPRPQGRRLGVQVDLVPALLDKHLKLGGAGLVVAAVDPESAADRAGLRADDVLTHVGGEEVRSVEQLRALVAKQPESYALRVIREGAVVELTTNPSAPR
ncbi:MAG TPA: PDZ domain-containing protein [Planctomycetota bacterium]|nr:PDZ domain-containing protein [Planctomycetota bacterium]